MLQIFICLCLSLHVMGTKFVGKTSALRIHYGRDMIPGEFPFMIVTVLVRGSRWFRWCSSSAITDRWLLTCAHCPNNMLAGYQLAIWPELTKGINQTGLFVNVTKIIFHPSYRNIEYEELPDIMINDNDICLLLVPQMKLERYGRLLAVDYTTLVGLPVTYVGSGGTLKGDNDEIRPIQVGGGAIVECDKQFRSESRYLICVTPKCSNRKHRLWAGDSGSPLLYDGMIIGVLSFGTFDDIARDGYTPVSPYLDWINEQIKDTE